MFFQDIADLAFRSTQGRPLGEIFFILLYVYFFSEIILLPPSFLKMFFPAVANATDFFMVFLLNWEKSKINKIKKKEKSCLLISKGRGHKTYYSPENLNSG